jgi:osmotically-inducible protein OsmY
MAAIKYKCVNFAGCDKALERDIIELEAGEEPVCTNPDCRMKLEPVRTKTQGPSNWWKYGLCALILLGLGIVIFWPRSPSKRPPAIITAPITPPSLPQQTALHPLPPDSCSGHQLASAIKDRIAESEELKAYTIQVDVVDETVILSGNVGSDMARNYAEDIVHRTGCSIASVVNDLKTMAPDQKIAEQIRKALAGNADLKLLPIRVEVSYGHVILSGAACDPLQRTVAADIASHTNGAITVTNNLLVSPPCGSSANLVVRRPAPPASLPPAQVQPTAYSSLAGSWTGTYQTCAGGQTEARFRITDGGPEDITATVEIPMPTGAPGSFVAHGVLNTMNGFLSLQFAGWQNQPPGVAMGNIGGYVAYRNGKADNFRGIIRAPGCGQIAIQRQ